MEVKGLTIDGVESRDLDDAIWLEDEGGAPVVTVSVADVAPAVEMDGELDRAALAQGFTHYRAWGNKPMLPESISEQSHSLLPGVERPVVAVRIRLGDDLEPAEVSVETGTLVSAARLAYPFIEEIMRGQPNRRNFSRHAPMLRQMADLATRLMSKRRERGALLVYDVNRGWAVTEEGNIFQLQLDQRNIGYVIVQEFMILANRAVAEYAARADVPFLYRSHKAKVAAPPAREMMHDIEAAFAHPEQFSMDGLRSRINLVLERATYGPANAGHYGLNLPAYCHFTSPLRRYADLVNHRILRAVLAGEPPPYTFEALEEVGGHLKALSDAERQKQGAHFKREKMKEVAKGLRDPAEQLADSGGSRFYQSLKVAAIHVEPPATLAAALPLRIARGKLTVKEAFYLLYEAPAGWGVMRAAAAEWVKANPRDAVSLLAMAHLLRGWSPVVYEYGMAGARFTCSALIKWRDGKNVRGLTGSATSKKQAQQTAAVSLCLVLCDMEQAAEPQAGTVEAPAARPADILADVAMALQAENYVGALSEICQKSGARHPQFQTEMADGPVPRAVSVVRVKLGDDQYEERGEGRTKKEARNRAAQAVIDRMRAESELKAEVAGA